MRLNEFAESNKRKFPKGKRLLAMMLSLCMMLTMLPTTAFAVTEKSGLGTSANTATAAEIAFGTDGSGTPRLWRVIGYNGNGVASETGSMTLLAKDNFGEIKFDSTDPYTNNYGPISSSSTPQSDLKTAIESSVTFTTAEENEIKPVNLTGGDNATAWDGMYGDDVIDAKLWPLSVTEANALKVELRNIGYTWWLRSPGSITKNAGYVLNDGYVNAGGNTVNLFDNGVRPALKLNLNSILFASAASGGKSSAEGGVDNFSEMTDTTLNLRFQDNNVLSSSNASISAQADSSTITYTAPADSVLVVEATADGTTYQARKNIISDTSNLILNLAELGEFAEGTSVTAKVWIEQMEDVANNKGLIYAIAPTDVSYTVEVPVIDKITITYSTSDDGTSAIEKVGASLEDALTGVDVNTVKHLTVKAGEVTTDDWIWIKSLAELTHLTVEDTDAVTSVADIPTRETVTTLPYLLVEVNIPKVTTIGEIAFRFCTRLTTVNIPDVTTIGDSAFFGCDILKTANFPKAITIGKNAFVSCPDLETADFPKVTTIDDEAFKECAALTTVNFPEVTSVGISAFEDCNALETVDFPNMTTIGFSAFYHCDSLTTANFPKATTIRGNAFGNCIALETANFPNVTTIDNGAFYKCNKLTTLGLGATPPSVGNNVFYIEGTPLARSLKFIDETGNPLTGDLLITAPNAYKAVDDGNTEDNLWYGWEFVPAPDKITVEYSTKDDGTDLVEKGGAGLEDALDGVALDTVKHLTVKAGEVTEVDWNWIHNLTALTHFIVEDTAEVTTVADIPDCSTSIFPNLIVEVNIPKMESIGNNAFANCSALTTIEFPKVTSIGNCTVYYCEKLTTANFPNMKSIGISAFESCSALETIDFPKVTTIAPGAFSKCSKLTTVNIPEATTIGNYTFFNCTSLETANFPQATTVGKAAFADCIELTTADFPKVTTIGEGAFANCKSLQTANLPKATTIDEGAFSSCNALEIANFPNVTTIGDGAFNNCKVLTTLGLGATPPTSVGTDAFLVEGTPLARSLNLLDENGNPLTGATRATAQHYYKIYNDGNQLDNLWYGWEIVHEPVADKITVAYSENGTDYTEKGGASLESTLADANLSEVKYLTVKAGEMTENDWNWIHNLSALTHFTVEDTVTTVADIPNKNFENVFPSSILEVNVSKVTNVGDFTFYTCKDLTTANFPQATTVGKAAFAGCIVLTTANIPEVTTIGESAFLNCSALETANFPNVTTIGESAFGVCTGVVTVDFPNVTSIGQGAFSECSALETANFPKVTTLAIGAFYKCIKLTTLGLGSTPPSVADRAFEGTPDARSLKFIDENGNPLTGDALTTAQDAYKAVNDGDTTDNLWHGFKIFDVIKTYNVTVKNGTANKATAAEGDTVTITADAPPSGKMFDCWKTSDGVIFADENASQTTFEMPSKEVTVTATYKNLSSGTISGKVTEEDGTAVAGATVEIIKSNKDKATAVTTTNANGEYTISDIRYGVYSLVVTHGERTNTSIVVIGEETVEKNITLLSGKKDTVLEVNPVVTTPAIAVENLEKMFDGTEDDAKDTKIKLVISDKTTSKPDEKKVKSKVNGQKKIGIYLDASLVKIVEGEEPKNIQPPTGKRLKIVVDVPVEAQNKAPYFVVRVHGENVETFEATYDEIYHTVTFNADKFSTYAIAYTDPTVTTYDLTINGGGTGVIGSGKYALDDVINVSAGTKNDYTFSGWTSNNGGKFADANSANTTFTMPANAVTITANWTKNSSGSTSSSSSSSSDDYYNITVIKGENGSVSPDGGSDNKVSVREYQDQKFTITADEGYVISDVLVDDKSVGARDKYTFEDVRKNHTIKVIFEEKSEANKDAENPFADVRPDDWFYDEALTIMKKGIMTGTSDTKFSPYIGTTRATIATIIYRLENEPKANAQKPFKDVLGSQWYTDAINWCAEYGIVKGCGNDLFKPNQIITRQELCTILYRYLGYKGYDVSKRADLNAFIDEKETSNWSKDSVSYAVKTSLLKGNDRSELQPKNQATRAEVATVILNALKLLEA